MATTHEKVMGFCIYCDGTGKVNEKRCKKCDGKGSLPVDSVKSGMLTEITGDDDGYED